MHHFATWKSIRFWKILWFLWIQFSKNFIFWIEMVLPLKNAIKFIIKIFFCIFYYTYCVTPFPCAVFLHRIEYTEWGDNHLISVSQEDEQPFRNFTMLLGLVQRIKLNQKSTEIAYFPVVARITKITACERVRNKIPMRI